jgi:hypothetical protein
MIFLLGLLQSKPLITWCLWVITLVTINIGKITSSKFENFENHVFTQLKSIIGGRKESTGAGFASFGTANNHQELSWTGDSVTTDSDGNVTNRTYFNVRQHHS